MVFHSFPPFHPLLTLTPDHGTHLLSSRAAVENMPPRARGLVARQARADELRERRGVDDTTVVATAESNDQRTRTVSETIRLRYFPEVKKAFTAFCGTHFPNTETSADTLFRLSPLVTVTWALLTAFLLFWGVETAGDGRSGPHRNQQSVANMILRAYAFRYLYEESTGLILESSLFAKIKAWIRDGHDGLKQKLHLTDSKPSTNWLDLDTMKEMARGYLSPTSPIREVRSRFNMLLWMSIEIMTALRVGALSKGERYFQDQKFLLWRDLKLCVFKGEPRNRLGLKFRAPNGKTRNSQDILVVLSDEAPHWCNPITWILVLAQLVGKLPSEWTKEQLLDPTSFYPGETFRVLTFGQADSEDPVFMTSTTPAREAFAWCTNTFRYDLKKMSRWLRYDRPVTPHMFRKSAAVALKIAGESPSPVFSELTSGARFDLISRQLRHAFESTTWETYVGGVLYVDQGRTHENDAECCKDDQCHGGLIQRKE